MFPDILVILLLMVSVEEELLFLRKNAQTDLSMYL